jgi:hypothetical protein
VYDEAMNIFKTFKLTWWQAAVLKLTTLTLGIAIGAYWWEFFQSYIWALLVIAVLCGLYVLSVWWKQ